jgi:hypothetical protein
MRRLLLALALVAGCATSSPLVSQAPPAAQAEQPSSKPAPHVFWQHGHWAWNAEKQLYFWDAGGWAPERAGEVWIPGYWTRVEDQGKVQGWRWVEPRWEPAQK